MGESAGLGHHGEVAGAGDELEAGAEGGRSGASARKRIDGVVGPPDHRTWGVEAGELAEAKAGNAAREELFDCGLGALDAEGPFELGKGGMAGRRRVRTPGVSEDPADDPVRAGHDSVESGVVGVDEQVGEPRVVAAERERVAVEQNNAGDAVRVGKAGCGGDAGAERVADQDGSLETEAVFEALKKLEPAGHRVRAATLAVAERRQIECEDAVAPMREEPPRRLPDPRWLGRAPEQHDRRSRMAPAAVGEERPIDAGEVPG